MEMQMRNIRITVQDVNRRKFYYKEGLYPAASQLPVVWDFQQGRKRGL